MKSTYDISASTVRCIYHFMYMYETIENHVHINHVTNVKFSKDISLKK